MPRGNFNGRVSGDLSAALLVSFFQRLADTLEGLGQIEVGIGGQPLLDSS